MCQCEHTLHILLSVWCLLSLPVHAPSLSWLHVCAPLPVWLGTVLSSCYVTIRSYYVFSMLLWLVFQSWCLFLLPQCSLLRSNQQHVDFWIYNFFFLFGYSSFSNYNICYWGLEFLFPFANIPVCVFYSPQNIGKSVNRSRPTYYCH